MPTWHGAQLKHRDNFTFSFYLFTCTVETPPSYNLPTLLILFVRMSCSSQSECGYHSSIAGGMHSAWIETTLCNIKHYVAKIPYRAANPNPEE